MLPSFAVAPPVSVIDAARRVEETRSKPSDPMPTLAINGTIESKPGEATPLSLSVNTDGVLPDNSKIAIVGIPKGTELSAGKKDSSGVWHLAPDDLGEVTLTPSTDKGGKSELVIRLLTADGRVASEKRVTLVVQDRQVLAEGRASTNASEAVTPAQIEQLLKQGRALQRVGYMAGARLFYRRAMDAGSPDGAQALGETYDPTVLQKLGVRGLEPDSQEAQKWYARAQELKQAKRSDAH